MTQEDLDKLPISNMVLWQDEEGICSVIDKYGVTWMIGIYNGVLCKRRANSNDK
jgi:hypothetical protein